MSAVQRLVDYVKSAIPSLEIGVLSDEDEAEAAK